MEKEKRVVAAGHICIDITPIFPGKQVEQIGELLLPGTLVQMKGVNIHTGGAVANTGLALKLMGIDVSLMGKVGTDAFGSIIMEYLKKHDADNGMLVSEGEDTSYSVVLAVPGIDRIFLHNPGANDTFSYGDIDFSVIQKAALFHFGYPSIMKNMYQKQGAELKQILKRVKECGTAVSLDMAAIDPTTEAAEKDWKQILKNVLPYVDFFVPSVEELCYMLDKERYENWKQRAGEKDITEILTMEDIEPLGEKVIEFGARIVLIKCGAAGIYYQTAAEDDIKNLCERLNLLTEAWMEKKGFEKSYRPDAVISGTGAGDTCIAAFLASVLEEYTLEKALHMATAQGACCVASYDALGGIKTLKQLEKKIGQGWEKCTIEI